MSISSSPSRPERSKAAPIAGLLLVVAAAGFAVGEWAQGGGGTGVRPQQPTPAATPEQPPVYAAPLTAAWGTSPAPAPRATTPAAFATALPTASPDVVSRVGAEARAKIEALRSYIDTSCWTRGPDAPGVKLTLNLTFDATGREIARGYSEDRRAPAREFGQCLRRLQGTRLAIAPPGANIGVSIPVSFP